MSFIRFKSPLCSSLQCLKDKHIINKMREKTIVSIKYGSHFSQWTAFGWVDFDAIKFLLKEDTTYFAWDAYCVLYTERSDYNHFGFLRFQPAMLYYESLISVHCFIYYCIYLYIDIVFIVNWFKEVQALPVNRWPVLIIKRALSLNKTCLQHR